MKRRHFLVSVPGTLLTKSLLAQEHKTIPLGAYESTLLSLSSFLTGVPEQTLANLTEPGGSSRYILLFTLITEAYGADELQTLLNLYEAELAKHATPAQIANAILINADPVTKSISSMIMKIWLFGVWFGASQTQYIKNPNFQKDFVLSARAYIDSFAWKMAQTHPMGYSNFPFGSWGETPPSLKDFGLTT